MQIIEWGELIAGGGQRAPAAHGAPGAYRGPVALTIGVFDSLHLGHQMLIRAVVDNGLGAEAAVCTFRQNPAQVLGSRSVPGSILSFRQKMERLEGLGVAVVVLIDFSPEISKLSGKRFLDLLTGRLAIRRVVVGYNFHMGQGRDTGVRELGALLSGSDTELQVVPAARFGGEAVSSSRIRACIREARFDEAAAMMGQGYSLDLRDTEVVRGAGFWRMPALQVSQVLPQAGAYRATLAGPRGCRETVVWVDETEVRGEGELAGDPGVIRFERRLEIADPVSASTPTV